MIARAKRRLVVVDGSRRFVFRMTKRQVAHDVLRLLLTLGRPARIEERWTRTRGRG